ncbi:NAD(P)H-hydrate dehydratase [Agrilactobacillus fermenti]|uniref:NAD(P)H-hydrate dehydratase n=1 Tax=Agrilactobacillus fermenti TaxID=2586909 RepID=UPI001E641343|nr:NAD(P)H-hydrate dehydratase [Agrilactobacillus fermenti]MCD2257141.1 NAD(P)H-hydrate dehydratase [Agrilactobacillus fermenti]
MNKITLDFVKKTVIPRKSATHKGNYGRILIIGGNQNFGGAAIMSATAAVYAGAGLVTTATDPMNFTALHARLPESMVLDFNDLDALSTMMAKMDVVVIGPGLGTDAPSEQILRTVLNQVSENQSIIIDGSAITLIAAKKLTLPRQGHLIFTPHQMEWQRLSDITIANQTDANNQQALQKMVTQNKNIYLVLKSNQTKVYLPNQEIWVNTTGNPGMATGGSGDALTGILAAFIGQFKPLSASILAGVYTHSAVADQIYQEQYVVLPQRLSERLPYFMHQLADRSNQAHQLGFHF